MTSAALTQKLAICEYTYEGMTVLIPSSTPVGDRLFVASWLQSKTSSHTRLTYRLSCELFFSWMFSPARSTQKTSITEVMLPDLQAYVSYLQTIYTKESTQATKLAALKSLWTFGCKLQILPYNVAAAVTLPRGKDELAKRILSLKQVYALIEAARRLNNQRNHTLIVLLYASAIRCEEACNLTWSDVIANDDGSDGGRLIVFGKRRNTRTILLHPFAFDLLMKLKPAHAAPDDPVFRSRQAHIIDGVRSYRLDKSSVWRIVQTVAQAAGIRASTHFFRHSHATHMLRKKVDLNVIMETLGHHDVRVLLRYLHVDPSESSSLHIDL